MTLYPHGVYYAGGHQTNHRRSEEPAIASQGGHTKRVEQAHKSSLRRRLNRILGQVDGIGRMIDEDRYCIDILIQVSAVRSALNQVAMQLVEDHTKGCVNHAIQAGRGDEAIAELMAVLQKLTK